MTDMSVEKRFEYKGYPCVIIFHTYDEELLSHGLYLENYLCGYVGLPKTSKFYKKNYDDIPIDCHGGLTYGSNQLFGQNDPDTFWIGYDCAHYGDSIFICNLEYCEEQCRSIVDQIIEAESVKE